MLRSPLLLLGALPLLGAAACERGGSRGAAGRADSPAAVATTPLAAPCPGDSAGLVLPAGFCATVLADGVAHARHAVVAANGDVYVTIEGTRPSPEKRLSGATGPAPATTSVVALRDTNRDGRADILARLGTLGNTGIGLAGGYLYVDEGTRIVRYQRPDSALLPPGRAEIVVDGLPLTGHRARNFLLVGDTALYVNVGSASNNCQQKDRAPESPGLDPCRELLTRAGWWRFDPRSTGQRFGSRARFATGIRNGMGMALGPDGKLYGTQHGRDQLHDNWPRIFPSTRYQAENPGEELIQVERGDDFGWPYCYYAMDRKTLVDAPEYGGDGERRSRCTGRKGPLAAYPGHWAPMSLLFYTGTAFPAHYRNGAFIAFHGSWNRAPEPQAGYRVVFQPFEGGQPTPGYETFADGFAGVSPALLQPGTAKHRPTGLALTPDGALIVTDDLGGRIYRITYAGTR